MSYILDIVISILFNICQKFKLCALLHNLFFSLWFAYKTSENSCSHPFEILDNRFQQDQDRHKKCLKFYIQFILHCEIIAYNTGI